MEEDVKCPTCGYKGFENWGTHCSSCGARLNPKEEDNATTNATR